MGGFPGRVRSHDAERSFACTRKSLIEPKGRSFAPGVTVAQDAAGENPVLSRIFVPHTGYQAFGALRAVGRVIPFYVPLDLWVTRNPFCSRLLVTGRPKVPLALLTRPRGSACGSRPGIGAVSNGGEHHWYQGAVSPRSVRSERSAS